MLTLHSSPVFDAGCAGAAERLCIVVAILTGSARPGFLITTVASTATVIGRALTPYYRPVVVHTMTPRQAKKVVSSEGDAR